MASKRKRVSKHISVDEENKVVYLIDDGEDMARMEEFALSSYQKNGYEVRVPKPVKRNAMKSRGKAYFKKECTSEEWEEFQKLSQEHKPTDISAFDSYRRAIDWFYEQHPDKKPVSRVKREQEQEKKAAKAKAKAE